ncbi:MAG: MBL fold metallo-hydrolase [Bacteroidetes bacterium]|nr:MBL fold metallo-hydrolase [Bacteroidota bacterium]
MKLHTIETGFFKLDGGAMHGVVPKSLWSKENVPDEKNMCNWAMRCLLVEDGERLILIDNGMGDKQDAKFFGHYFLNGNDSLEKSLKAKGFDFSDITDMFLTHLHFDHCGGSIKYNSDRSKLITAFPNATYWSNETHWEWATKPNAREKASFLKENILPIKESGQLKFLKEGEDLFPGFKVLWLNGHTGAMMLPQISYKGKTVTYMADLMPSVAHIPLPWIMAYDTRPLLTLAEKEIILPQAAKEEHVFFFEHDGLNECCTVEETERGVRVKQKFSLADYFGR